jgi:hypothetical protein
VPAALGASPRGTVLRIKLGTGKRRAILLSDLPGAGINLNIWRLGVVVLSTDLPDTEWYPRVTATPENMLPTQHPYRVSTEFPLAVSTDDVVKVGGPIDPVEMAAIDRVLKTLFGF